MKTINFTSFDRPASGRVIAGDSNYFFVQSRNPYGSHNLVAVDRVSLEAFRHGAEAVVFFAANWAAEKTYRKVRRFLAERVPATRQWCVVDSREADTAVQE